MAKTQIGYVGAMHGEKFKISVTNAPVDALYEAQLNPCSLLISSPVDELWYDVGTPVLLATDVSGNVLQLTYSFKIGEGFILDSENPNVLKLGFDNHTIKTYNNKLYVDTEALIRTAPNSKNENNSLTIGSGTDTNNYLLVNTKAIIDELSIKHFNVGNWLKDNNGNNGINLTQDYKTKYSYHITNDVSFIDTSAIIDNHYLSYSYIIDDNLKKISGTDNIDDYINYVSGNDLLLANARKITINFDNLVDGETIIKSIDKEQLKVNTQALDKATGENLGVVVVDNLTIESNNGLINVNTQALDKSTDKQLGVVMVDNSTIKSVDGLISVYTQELQKSTYSQFGVVMVDDSTIKSVDGLISVYTQALDKATDTQLGVVMVDNSTIKSLDNGKINVDTQALTKSDNNTYGVVTGDNSTIVTSAGIISLSNNYINIIQNLTNTVATLSALLKQPTTSILSFEGIGTKYNVIYNDPSNKDNKYTLKILSSPDISSNENIKLVITSSDKTVAEVEEEYTKSSVTLKLNGTGTAKIRAQHTGYDGDDEGYGKINAASAEFTLVSTNFVKNNNGVGVLKHSTNTDNKIIVNEFPYKFTIELYNSYDITLEAKLKTETSDNVVTIDKKSNKLFEITVNEPQYFVLNISGDSEEYDDVNIDVIFNIERQIVIKQMSVDVSRSHNNSLTYLNDSCDYTVTINEGPAGAQSVLSFDDISGYLSYYGQYIDDNTTKYNIKLTDAGYDYSQNAATGSEVKVCAYIDIDGNEYYEKYRRVFDISIAPPGTENVSTNMYIYSENTTNSQDIGDSISVGDLSETILYLEIIGNDDKLTNITKLYNNKISITNDNDSYFELSTASFTTNNRMQLKLKTKDVINAITNLQVIVETLESVSNGNYNYSPTSKTFYVNIDNVSTTQDPQVTSSPGPDTSTWPDNMMITANTTSFIVNTSITLTLTGAPTDSTYNWYSSNVTIVSIPDTDINKDTITIKPTNTGNVTIGCIIYNDGYEHGQQSIEQEYTITSALSWGSPKITASQDYIYVGDTFTLTVTGLPDDDFNFEWGVRHRNIAEILSSNTNQNSISVEALETGDTVISCNIINTKYVNGYKQLNCDINVANTTSGPTQDTTPITNYCREIGINETNLNVTTDTTNFNLAVYAVHENDVIPANSTYAWESSNKNVVDINGESNSDDVTFCINGPGNATITCTVTNPTLSGSLTATCNVTVTSNSWDQYNDIYIELPENILVNDDTITCSLSGTIPSNTTYEWSIIDNTCAIIKDGTGNSATPTISIIKGGSTTIKCKLTNANYNGNLEITESLVINKLSSSLSVADNGKQVYGYLGSGTLNISASPAAVITSPYFITLTTTYSAIYSDPTSYNLAYNEISSSTGPDKLTIYAGSTPDKYGIIISGASNYTDGNDTYANPYYDNPKDVEAYIEFIKAKPTITCSTDDMTFASIGSGAQTRTATRSHTHDQCKIKVSSSNENVATASISGSTITVTPKGTGNCTIRLNIAESEWFTAAEQVSFNVTVNAGQQWSSKINISAETLEIPLNGNYVEVRITGVEDTGTTYKWTIDNNYATIVGDDNKSSVKVSPQQIGGPSTLTCTLTNAKYAGELIKSCAITISNNVFSDNIKLVASTKDNTIYKADDLPYDYKDNVSIRVDGIENSGLTGITYTWELSVPNHSAIKQLNINNDSMTVNVSENDTGNDLSNTARCTISKDNYDPKTLTYTIKLNGKPTESIDPSSDPSSDTSDGPTSSPST